MLDIAPDSVERWAEDTDCFIDAFVVISTALFRTVGIDVTFSRVILTEVHGIWVEEKKRWENNLFPTENHNLAEIKVLSIMLWALTRKGFIIECRDYEPEIGDATYEFKSMDGLEVHRDRIKSEAKSDFLNAPDIICALDFCLVVINAFEEVRTDRLTELDPFLAPEFRHNLIYYLKQSDVSALSVYTTLEANYSRFSRF
jgi:hypothetical protein